jgi:hypothetical protein
MRKKGPTKTKNEGKGAHKDQNKGNRPSKTRAYESLNPGLIIDRHLARGIT